VVCFIKKKCFFSEIFFFLDNGLKETGLSDVSVEVLHSLLIQIHQYISNESSGIKIEQYEQLLNLLRKGFENNFLLQMNICCFSSEYPSERINNNGSLILLPILYPSNILSKDLTPTQILSDSSNLSTSVV